MEVKRPFSEADWLATPEPVRQHVDQLEKTVIALVARVEQLEKRIEQLETSSKKILKTPVNRHHQIARMKSRNGKRLRRKIEKEALRKAIRATSRNCWNRQNKNQSCLRAARAAI